MPNRRVLIIEDRLVQCAGIRSMLHELGEFEIDVREDVEGALRLLDERAASHEEMYFLILSDMELPERKGQKPDIWAGANLLHIISKNYSKTNLVLYTCVGELPSKGDFNQLMQAGASALWGPNNVSEKDFLDQLRQVVSGNMVINRAFKDLARLAADPGNRCPFDPVQYYCIRLIAENRGRKGAAEEWNRARACDPNAKEVTWNMIDELLGEIYIYLADEIEDFESLLPEQKNSCLSNWYWNAIPRYGAAVPVNYETPKQRRKKYPLN